MTLTAAAEAGARYTCQSSAAAADINGITAAVASAAGNPGNLSVATTAFCTCTPGGLQVACSTSCSGKAAYTKIRATLPFTTVMIWPGMPSFTSLNGTAVTRVQ